MLDPREIQRKSVDVVTSRMAVTFLKQIKDFPKGNQREKKLA